jgi:hypothetical protein
MHRLVLWIQDNWEAAVSLFLLLAVLVYDSIHLIRPTVIPQWAQAEAITYVVMLMLGSMTIMLLRIRARSKSENADQLVDRLVGDHAGRNPFIESLLRSKLEFLKDLKRETFGATLLSINQLVDAVRLTERGDEIQAVDYGPGWKPAFQQLQNENIEARKRGVKISRIFIIPQSIASNRKLAKSLWETMLEQAAGGIAVAWVAQADLKDSVPELANVARGMVLLRYESRDCSLLTLDAPDAHVILMAGGQPKFELYWNKRDELHKHQVEFRQLESLKILKELSGTLNPVSSPPFLTGGRIRSHSATQSDR